MAYQALNLTPGAGDSGVAGGTKINANFTELYAADVTLLASILAQHAGHISQRVYPNFPKLTTATATVATVADTVYYTPMLVPLDVTLDRLILRTGSANATAANANIGFYNNAAGGPGTLRASITAVPIPGAINTNVLAAPGAGSLLLPRGVYWHAAQFDAAPQMTGHADNVLHAWFGGTTNAAAYFGSTSQVQGLTEAATYLSGLPATATPTAGVTAAITSGAYRVL